MVVPWRTRFTFGAIGVVVIVLSLLLFFRYERLAKWGSFCEGGAGIQGMTEYPKAFEVLTVRIVQKKKKSEGQIT